MSQQYVRTFHGTTSEESRAVTCAYYVNTAMGLVVSKLYVKKYFYKDARAEVMRKTKN